MRRDRKQAEADGRSAERAAQLLLTLKGYRILASRVRTPLGEIDLIAFKAGTVVFLEVKARQDITNAAEAITPRQQQRIAAAAEVWLASHPEYADMDARFDAMLVARGKLPHHLIDAWRP